MEWQPIETAPRDGRWIRLWRGECATGRWSPEVIGKWDGYEWAWPDDVYDVYHDAERANDAVESGDCYADGVSFTHWMPLPPPPTVTR